MVFTVSRGGGAGSARVAPPVLRLRLRRTGLRRRRLGGRLRWTGRGCGSRKEIDDDPVRILECERLAGGKLVRHTKQDLGVPAGLPRLNRSEQAVTHAARADRGVEDAPDDAQDDPSRAIIRQHKVMAPGPLQDDAGTIRVGPVSQQPNRVWRGGDTRHMRLRIPGHACISVSFAKRDRKEFQGRHHDATDPFRSLGQRHHATPHLDLRHALGQRHRRPWKANPVLPG